ncbi:MAG: SRPBCC family protein [Acidimicrobiia bacterium]
MAERASQEIEINSHLEKVLEIILELDQYPVWIDEVQSVEVHDRDSRGRAITATLVTSAMGKTINQTYKYDYSKYPLEISWSLTKGDMLKSLSGKYSLEEKGEYLTKVKYELDVEMSVSLPGFIKKKAAQKIVSSALDNLKKRCESF